MIPPALIAPLARRLIAAALRPVALAGLCLGLSASAWAWHGSLARRAIDDAVARRVVQAEEAARAALLSEGTRALAAERAAATRLRAQLAEAEEARDRALRERETHAETHPLPPADCRVTSDLLRRLRL